MKNKELLNICSKFFNRFITASELIEMLSNMDKKSLSEEEIEKIDELLDKIKTITNNTPNEEDEYVKREKEIISNLLKRLEKDVVQLEGENKEFLNKQINNLKKEYDRNRDSHERWFKITDYINNNEYFNTCFDNLSEYELLEFIAQNIQAPFPPQLNQEEFERLVKVGIENDEREWLWRLAFNYERSNINFDSIVEYFIKIKDGYYIAELINAVGECLDIDDIIDKINDKELIEDLKNRKSVIEFYVSEEQFNKLINKLNN